MARTNSPKTTSNAASTVNKKTSSTATLRRNSSNESQNSKWMLVPSVILTLFGIAMFVSSTSGALSFTFIEPLVAILLATLGLALAWKVAKREVARRYVQVIAWIFAVVVALATIYWFGGAGDNTCTGLMGVQTSCMSVNRLMITIWLLNPFSLILWGALAIAGLAGLSVKPRKS
ncbi:hypothetical protein [Streptomyces sp. NPDC006997]|uniref:hypothetical protein n=1 Tax=Streptomyces sp. NPDC006997 TaxID=3155356 RepID=UPI0033E6C657